MKRYILLLSLALIPYFASAQMSIDEPSAKERGANIAFRDSIRMQAVDHNYFSPALHRHQRHLIREDRNTLTITGNFQGSLLSLSDSWIESQGGDNTITLLSTLSLSHKYTKGDFSVSTTFSAKFGFYRVMLETTVDDVTEEVPTWFKNQDEIVFQTTPSLKLSDNWSYGPSLKFRSQFANGYVSKSAQESYNLKSSFMSPGYLDLSGSLIYTSPNAKYPVTLTLSPVAMSAVYVLNNDIITNARYGYGEHTDDNDGGYVEAYGVSPYYNSKYEGGSSIQIDYSKSFGKDSYLTYTTSVYSFYGWMTQLGAKNVYSSVDLYNDALTDWNSTEEGDTPTLTIHPTVRWENTLTIKASKYISTTINFQLYYNRAENFDLQTQTYFNVGLTYSFKNK